MIENSKFIIIFFFVAIFSVVSCSTTKIPDVDDFQVKDIPRAEIFPSQSALEGKKTKIAIYPIKDPSEAAKKAQVADKVTGEVTKYLLESNVEIIDRQAADKYKDEVVLATQSGNFSGPQFADYVIQGELEQTNFDVSLDDEVDKLALGLSLIQDSKNPNLQSKKVCNYRAKVSGRFALYALPEMNIIQTFPFSGTGSTSQAPSTRGATAGDAFVSLFTGNIPATCPVSQSKINTILNEASSDAVRRYRIDLQNFFAPKGYISQMRQLGKLTIVKINVGKNNNIKEGSPIEIYTVKPVSDPLSGKINNEERKVGKGVVSNQIGPNYSWIILQGEGLENKIHIGDYVKILFEKGSFESISDFDFL